MSAAIDIVIFGGSGDLSLRKLLPALYRAQREGALTSDSRILLATRDAQFVEVAHERVTVALQQYLSPGEFNISDWQHFKALVSAIELDISQLSDQWQSLQRLLQAEPDRVRLFYLAVPPSVFSSCCQQLASYQLISKHSRVVVEKPLGYDAETAAAINTEIGRYFDETAIYRIDHYLGKETVQNLMALRFSNLIFEQLWDAKSIDHVQISIAETVGLEGRAGFYDEVGALRDMVQNHLLQLLCLVAMEAPNKMDAKNIRAEKIKVLEAMRPISGEQVGLHTVRGQYMAGGDGDNAVPGYLEQLPGGTSQTETFVAIRAHIDNWRWAKVPFYLRTGKRMAERCAEIVIQYKDVSHRVYPAASGAMQPNRLVIRLQPEESIQLSMMSKDLGDNNMRLKPALLNLNFSETYQTLRSDAYKRLLLDAAAGDSSLFIHRDEVAAAWAWIDPIIAGWHDSAVRPADYEAGSWGPCESDQLLAEEGHCWLNSQ